MLKLTGDLEHSDSIAASLEWNRSAPICGPGVYEVHTYDIFGQPNDFIAFFAEAYVRG